MKQLTTHQKGNVIAREWHLIDLEGKTLGRVCTEIAVLLMGKNKPTYSFHRDAGDYVVAINCEKIVVTGKKRTDKKYYHHTPFSGHLKTFSFQELQDRDPRRIIERGVNNMLPKNKLRDPRLERLKIIIGSEHKFNDKFKKI